MTYGKLIPNLKIDGREANYGVVNERDARAGAGIMLIIAIFSFTQALYLKNLTFLYATVIAFTVEFLFRIIDPHIAPFYFLGSLIVKGLRPEWSGAVQKRFAWTLGLAMAVSMIFISIIFQIRGTLPFSVCAVCLSLLWLETSFGICVGCKMYFGLMKLGIIKTPKIIPACPGGVCPIDKPRK